MRKFGVDAERLLNVLGFRVARANNGVEAIECFKNCPFDSVSMDIQIPATGGIGSTEASRTHEM